MDKIKQFEEQREQRIENQGVNKPLIKAAESFQVETIKSQYSYNFTWMGQPVIQYPQDIVIMQEIVWKVKPDLIIETGIAHGGSLIFSASMLEILGGNGQVLGIDIDIREHNRVELEKHPMFKRITMIEGSSIDEDIAKQVYDFAKNKEQVLVLLDSMHTYDHVFKELKLYSPLVTKGSYLVVFDTIIEDMPENFFPDRPWGKGNNPKTAVWEFMKDNDRFEIDKKIEDKLLITVAPEGYLKRVR